MRAILQTSTAGWTLNRALGLDVADRSPVAPADLPTTAVFVEPVVVPVPFPANSALAINQNRARLSRTSAHRYLQICPSTRLHVFSGLEQLVIASQPTALPPLAFTAVAMEPSAAPILLTQHQTEFFYIDDCRIPDAQSSKCSHEICIKGPRRLYCSCSY